ncbi:unnamed protein product [Rotaria magnacalcarata]|uniref:Ionotropic glutamate receptor C-terminal domain-containing protein n=3 Tax=Rotaria magnacalcarata TaxID=392030 RepID=A0A816M2N2_9BILA|nr:unnamed protein product [Rotaria magnacalcarata]
MFLLLLLSVLLYNTSQGKHEESEPQRLNHERYLPSSTWPSFTNKNGSYIYFMGLFLKYRTSTTLAKHFQTSAEPAMFRAAILLAQRLNMTINGKQIAYHIEETSGCDVIEALNSTCVYIAEYQILGIVGPEYSTEAKTLASFGNRAGLPIIGYSTTEPELSDRYTYRTFYRLPPSDVIKALALLKLFQKYKWSFANVIYQGDSYGQGGLQALNEAFRGEVKISCSIRFDLLTDTIENLRRQLEVSPSRIVVVMANANVTTKILHLALEAGDILAPSFLWILTAGNSSMSIPHHQNINQLTGILMLRLVPPHTFDISTNTYLLNEALNIWKENDADSFHQNWPQLDVFALYAFDAIWMLILAFQELCQQNATNCLSFENHFDCFANHLTAGNELHRILQTMNFTGVTGLVQFGSNKTDRVDGIGAHYVIENIQPPRANSHRLQIVEVLRLNGTKLNITRNSETEWMPTGNRIRWPRKWDEAPTDYALLKGKTLNITVYISPPFFMKTSSPDIHGQYLYEGYIHELLLLLKEKIGFNFTYTVASNETSYDELVECVQNRTCEIVIADLAITSSRQSKIDFSAPIYHNALRLVVRKSKQKTIDQFAFLKPFSLSLWLMIIGLIYMSSALFISIYEYQKTSNAVSENQETGNHVNERQKTKTNATQADKKIKKRV